MERISESDRKYMQMALDLAVKAKGRTCPNPVVGAVIVRQDHVLSCGYHRRYGAAHAEQQAIRDAAVSVAGASLYVTLEPCVHYGNTPPCADLIISSGIKEVIIAAKDPNPIVNGKGIAKLRAAGVDVRTGVLRAQAQQINRPFFTYHQKKRPFVTAKIAESLDGRIATATGDSQWITSSAARRFARALRSEADAVLIGINTVRTDNPSLYGSRKPFPKRLILDTHLTIPVSRKVLDMRADTYLFCSEAAHKRKSKKVSALVRRSNIHVVAVRLQNGRISVPALLSKLYQIGIQSVFVEGGAEVLGSFFDAAAVDKVFFFVAPKIIGGCRSKSAVSGNGVARIKDAVTVINVKAEKRGKDFLIEGTPLFKTKHKYV